MKKYRLISLLLLLLVLGGCSKRETPIPAAEPAAPPTAAPVSAATPAPEAKTASAPAPDPTPEPSPTPSPTPAPPIAAGSYRFESDELGSWTLLLKDSNIFTVIGGDAVYNGEGWADNGNGTVTTGPTEAAGAAPFFDEFGSSVWAIAGENCTPVY